MTPAAKAWLVLLAWVIGWDILSRPGETLSEGVDRWLLERPWVTRLTVVLVALHLINLIPPRFDVIHRTFTCTKRLLAH